MPDQNAPHCTENGDICPEFTDTGRCAHSDAEHDALADGRPAETVVLTEDEREDLYDWWDEDSTVSVESAFPVVARIIAERVSAARQAAVWVDPGRCGGEPCIMGTRLTTRSIAQTMWAYGSIVAEDCWPHVTSAQLRGACWYEARYGAKKWRKRWGTWADDCMDDMWSGTWDLVPDPPRKVSTPTGSRIDGDPS